MIGNEKAIIELASNYVLYNLKTASIGWKKCEYFSNQEFGRDLINIAKALIDFGERNDRDKAVVEIKCLAFDFLAEYDIAKYFECSIIDFNYLGKSVFFIPVLMLLDYFYSGGERMIFGLSVKNEPMLSTVNFELQGKSIPWSDCLLICHYIGNKRKGALSRGLIDLYADNYLRTLGIKEVSAQDYLDIMAACILYYRNALGNKVCKCQRNLPISGFSFMARLIGRDYNVKTETTPVLNSLIRELSYLDIHLLPESADELTVFSVTYKLGNMVISQIECYVQPDHIEVSYKISQFEDSNSFKSTDRSFFVKNEMVNESSNYLIYTDMVALILILRNSSYEVYKAICPLFKKYFLMQFRAVNIKDEQTYSEFLSLADMGFYD